MGAISFMDKSVWTIRLGACAMGTELMPAPTDGCGVLIRVSGKEDIMSESEHISADVGAEALKHLFASARKVYGEV